MSHIRLFVVIASLIAVPVGAAPAPKAPPPLDGWPMFGGTPGRNMVNVRDKLTTFPKDGPNWEDKEEAKKWEAEWVLWKADLGGSAPGCRLPTSTSSPVIVGGRIYIGTNNRAAR